MKKISKYLMMFLMGTFIAVPLASCSDSNDDPDNGTDLENPTITNNWSGTKSEMWEVANNYVNNVVYPTYQKLASSAEELYTQAVNMQTKFNAGSLTDADVEAVCDAFVDARVYWERSEAFLFGAASDFNIDPHMDSWPLDQGQMANFLSNSSMIAGLHGIDPIAFVSSNNSNFDTALGFHGVEFVLYRDGAPRKASVFSGNETHESFSGKTVACSEEIAFLVAVAGDLRDHCYQLEVSWLGNKAELSHIARVTELGYKTRALDNKGYYYGADMLMAGKEYSTYKVITTALVTFVGDAGCSNICNEVADQKLGQAYRVATGHGGKTEDGEDESINYIESPYSHRSFIDYRDNLYSIKNSLYGTTDINATSPTSKSVLTFMKNHNYSGYNDLVDALNTAIQSLTTPINAGKTFVGEPGAAHVKTAIDAIGALNEELLTASQWIEKQ